MDQVGPGRLRSVVLWRNNFQSAFLNNILHASWLSSMRIRSSANFSVKVASS